jgi:predicted ATPase
MSVQAIEVLIERQTALIAALDSGDISAIEFATQDLASAVETVRAQDAWHDRSALDHLNYAMKQTHAARIRVNYLSEWTRQKIDQFAELRGVKMSSNNCKY